MREPAPHPDDAKLVLLAMAGDEHAFGVLVRQHQVWLVNLLWRILGDAHAAEDAAQVSLMKAWSNLSQLDQPERFRAWLRTIAIRAAIEKTRRRHRRDEQLDEADTLADPSASVQRAEQKLDLAAALQRLTLPQRACVLLAHAEGLTHPEIADLLAMPAGTVKSHLARGLAILRVSLTEWEP